MNDYSDTMLEKTRLCSGCKKMYFMEPGINQCSTCNNRGAVNREKLRATAVVVPCGKSGCTHSKSADNAYCRFHQICLFEDECTNAGTRPCVRYLHGCRVQLSPDYLNRSCAECLEKERMRDRAARSAVVSEVVDGVKQCSVCCKSNPVDYYVGANGQETKTCRLCRNEFNKQNEKRDKEHVRELDRKNSKKPERVVVKQQWNENNYEKVVLKTLNYRQRQIEGNYDEYLARNAHNAAKWRENNPEKVKESNDKRLHNIESYFVHYKYDSTQKRLMFELSLEQFETIVTTPCFYCNIIQEKGFNGIDRMDQKQGYVIENCVSCCKLCNFMKGALDNITFLQRVEHILKRNTMITGGSYHPSAFQNHNSSSYSSYKKRAEQKGLAFELTIEDFDKLILENCYICGKQTDEDHTNGVDRFDNEKGYTFHNANACCGECNLMKKEIDYDVMLEQLKKIYDCTQGKEMPKPSATVTTITSPSPNKMSKTEIKDHQETQREIRRKAIRDKYADHEFLKKHAEDIVKNRRNI